MSIQIKDEHLERGLSKAIGHSAPFSTDELKSIKKLRIKHAHDLAPLAECLNLKNLTLVGCEIENLDALKGFTQLDILRVEYSTLTDISALGTIKSLMTVQLDCNNVENITPLLELPRLSYISLVGNPLSSESYHDIIPKLPGASLDKKYSGKQEWELTLELRQRGMQACYYRENLDYYLCVPGLEVTEFPEAGHALIKPDALRAELANPDADLRTIYQKYQPQLGSVTILQPFQPTFDFQSHRIIGQAEDAKRWVNESELDLKEKTALLSFVDRFPGIGFFKEDDELLNYVEQRDSIKLPDWLRAIRKTLAYPYHPEQYLSLQFDRFETDWMELGNDETYSVFNLRGSLYPEEREAVIVRAGAFPIGNGGPSDQRVLAINLKDPNDKCVYHFVDQDVFDDLFKVYLVAFKSYAEMFDHIVAIRFADGTEIRGA
jgi:hypothetical protein